MSRRWFRFLVFAVLTVSTLLALASAAMWVRTRYVSERWSREVPGGSILFIESGYGTLWLDCRIAKDDFFLYSIFAMGRPWGHLKSEPDNDRWSRIDTTPVMITTPFSDHRGEQVRICIPYWLIFLLGIWLPIVAACVYIEEIRSRQSDEQTESGARSGNS